MHTNMGNSDSDTAGKNSFVKYYNYHYTSLNKTEIARLRTQYKIVEVEWLDMVTINSKIFGDPYFANSPHKQKVIHDIVHSYLHDKDTNIYKQTDYLCNEKEKMCICNTHADDFRKIYEGINYKPNTPYIGWCKKPGDNF